MLENIALIASVISGLTALTTSLRALGVSREQSRYEESEKIRTGCRVSGYQPVPPSSQRSSLRLHLLVTCIWYILSALCALPSLMREPAGRENGLFPAILLFLLLAVLIALVWKKVLQRH